MAPRKQQYAVTVLDGRQQPVVSERFEQLEDALEYVERLALPGHTVRLSSAVGRHFSVPHSQRSRPWLPSFGSVPEAGTDVAPDRRAAGQTVSRAQSIDANDSTVGR